MNTGDSTVCEGGRPARPVLFPENGVCVVGAVHNDDGTRCRCRPVAQHSGTDARQCAECVRRAESRVHRFHASSDVGPWDDVCPACGHICDGECR